MGIRGSLYTTGMESTTAILIGEQATYIRDQQKKWHKSNFNGQKLLTAIRRSGFKLEHQMLNYKLEV